jgi:hypothetical protein
LILLDGGNELTQRRKAALYAGVALLAAAVFSFIAGIWTPNASEAAGNFIATGVVLMFSGWIVTMLAID